MKVLSFVRDVRNFEMTPNRKELNWTFVRLGISWLDAKLCLYSVRHKRWMWLVTRSIYSGKTGRWPTKNPVAGHVTQVVAARRAVSVWNSSLHKKVVIGSGWSLFRVVAEAEFYCMVFASDQGWRWRCLASKDCEVLTGVAADGQSLSQHRFAVDCFRFPLFFYLFVSMRSCIFCYLSLLLQSSSNRTWVAFKGTKSK